METVIKFWPLAGIIFLSGCAGSAAHKVVTAHQANDSQLTCEEIELEMAKAQAIIDEVNKDKDDVSGKDIVDGILWFPFNLIAKHQNYNEALKAADQRLAQLNAFKQEKACGVSDVDDQERGTDMIEQLKVLSQMHEEGTINDEEYRVAKQKLLAH